MSENKIEIWLRMYEEQIRHGRHHEVLRSQSTNMIVAISAALLAFISSNETPSGQDNIIGIFIIIINLYGLAMSLKHYERSRLHVGGAGKYRAVISAVSDIEGVKINDARNEGQNLHSTPFSHVIKIRAYVLWLGLHLILAVIGITVLFF